MPSNKIKLIKRITLKLTVLSSLTLTLLLNLSCSLSNPGASADADTDNAVLPAPLVIDEQSAAKLLANDPWDYFVDFGQALRCTWSLEKPLQSEPLLSPPTTVWQRIRRGYGLDWQTPHRRLDAEFNWYLRNPNYIRRVSERAQRYVHYVTEQLEAAQLPLELALLPIVESAYDPFAYSHGRASGMWQFIPSTGKNYRMEQNWWYDGRRDVVASTEGAIAYLKNLSSYYDGDWMLALAAYNSGQGNVNKAIRKNKKKGKATDFWSLDLPRETRSYVPKLLALAKLVDNPRRYGMELYPVANQPYFAAVDTGSQIDLAQAATMAGIDIDELYRLNPGFNRWATAPKGPHRILVPIAHEQQFKEQLAALPASKRLHWQRYTIKQGDSLLLLAKKFNTGVDTIKQINGIRGNVIRAGKTLMIPMALEEDEHYQLSADERLAEIQRKRTGGSNSKQRFHTVKSGESFWTISRLYGVTVAKLAHWNGVAPKDTLQPGQKLSVWTKKPVSLSQTGQREAVVRRVGYRVRSGDSLARIAGKFNVSVNDILRWNTVNPKRYLQPGQQLTLYVDITNPKH